MTALTYGEFAKHLYIQHPG